MDLFEHLEKNKAELAAKERRSSGVRSSAQHQDENTPGWTDRAFEAVKTYARTHESFTMEQCAEGCYAAGLPVPAEKRAWGGVTQRACRADIILDSGKTRPRISGNLTKTTLWTSLLYKPAAVS